MRPPTRTSSVRSDRPVQRECFLVHEGVLYFTRGDREPTGVFIHAAGPHNPLDTPVSILIHSISQRFPHRSLAMLRERIHTNYSLTPVCTGAIKIAAKRASVHDPDEYSALKISQTGQYGGKCEELRLPDERHILERPPLEADGYANTTIALDRAAIEELFSPFLGRSHGYCPPGSGPPPVAAALLDGSGKLLGLARNAGEGDRAGHAEIRLLRGLSRAGVEIPRGATLVVSLRPCAMCAGAIYQCAQDIWPLRVRFLEEDPGPASKNSCLYAHSDLWRQAGSPGLDVARLLP